MGMSQWTASTFFRDSRGERRLAERLAAAAQRTQLANRAQQFIDESSTSADESLRRELNVSEALQRPLGVPLALWLELSSHAESAGIAATAAIARRVSRAGGIERAVGARDWRGVHSDESDQPVPYSVVFNDTNDGGKLDTIERGSERLYSGYDFTSIHRRIESLAHKYRQTPSPKLRRRIESLALYYNVLAQFAPKLQASSVVDVDMIEQQMSKIRGSD